MEKYEWSITYQWHDSGNGKHFKTIQMEAESIGLALEEADKEIYDKFESENWLDYHITEVHVMNNPEF